MPRHRNAEDTILLLLMLVAAMAVPACSAGPRDEATGVVAPADAETVTLAVEGMT